MQVDILTEIKDLSDISLKRSAILVKEINKKKIITIEYIIKVVCDYFNLSLEQFHSSSQRAEVVQARQIAMFFAKNLTKYSFKTIGSYIGNKDRVTVMYSCKVVNNLIDTDKIFKYRVKKIEKKLKNK